MTNEPNQVTSSTDNATPVRCATGALISGGMAFGLYSLMIAIATTFAEKPIHSDNQIVIRLAAAVRTLVVGTAALGTGLFGIVALGLLALGGQLLIQQLLKPKND
jgi:hypothetical protein